MAGILRSLGTQTTTARVCARDKRFSEAPYSPSPDSRNAAKTTSAVYPSEVKENTQNDFVPHCGLGAAQKPGSTVVYLYTCIRRSVFPSVSFLPWTLRMPFLSFPHLPSVLCGAHCPPLRASSGPEVAGG